MSEYREFQDGQEIAGTRYRVVRLMGSGGMGTVYEVEHVELGKRFVLKALLRELARREDLVQRLRNEWRALGRLEHPNIVTVTDAGTTASGVPFFVMERLEGETLAERMQRVRRFELPEALGITISILDGLSAAHAIGIVHRDIKPPNIILVADNRPKILDFGVAKVAHDPGVVTARGVAVGTPRYMSPEQARGESVDGRADVYAAGLLLFEMVAGVGPFDDARDANEIILAHIARLPPRLSSLAMGVTPALDDAVAAMLHKNRHRRPASARECAELLRGVLAELTTLSRRPVPAPALKRVAQPAPVSTTIRTDATTRPEGLLRPAAGTRTSVSPPPSMTGLSTGFQTTIAAEAVYAPAPGCLPTLREAGMTSLPVPKASSAGGVMRGAGDTFLDPLSDAAVDSRSGVPSLEPAVARTEILSPVPVPEAKETRTKLPRGERLYSATPPPIAPAASSEPTVVRSGVRSVLTAFGVGVSAVAIVAVGILGWRELRRVPDHAEQSAADALGRSAAEPRLEPAVRDEAPPEPKRSGEPALTIASAAEAREGAAAPRAPSTRKSAERRARTASSAVSASSVRAREAPSAKIPAPVVSSAVLSPPKPTPVRSIPRNGALPGSGL